MRYWLLIVLGFVIPILAYAASVTELPDWKSTGYRVDFSSDDTGNTVVIGQTFPSARVSFEEDSAFSGNLYACDTKTFVADTCDLLTALTADVPEFTVRTNRTFYIVVVTTGDGSWLKIRGSHEDIIGGSILELDDVDASSFTGLAREVLAVNEAETLMEFVPRLGTNETEIYTASDLPTPSGGEITLPTGIYVLKNSITIADTIVVAPGAIVEIAALAFGAAITYTGTGTMFESASGDTLILRRMNTDMTGVGAQLFDLALGTSSFDGLLSLSSAASQSIGTLATSGFGALIQNTALLGFTTGLALSGSPSLVITSSSIMMDSGATGAVISADDATLRFRLDTLTVSAGASGSAFDIVAGFTGVATLNQIVLTSGGFFEAGSLDETSPFVTVSSSGAQKDSQNIGSVVSIGNTTATDMSGGPSAWVNLNLDTNAVAGSNIELWTLDSTTTGQVSYDGIRPFNGKITASISGTSSAGAQTFEFRVVVNGSPTADVVMVARDFTATKGAVMLLAPIVAANGDTVRIQVQNIDGTSNIVISELSVDISWILLIFIPIRRYAEAA